MHHKPKSPQGLFGLSQIVNAILLFLLHVIY